MLLLDSWSARVTATCSVKSRHPLSRTYGTNLPNSLTSVDPDRPWLSPPEYLCRISVRSSPRLFTGSRYHRLALSRASFASCRYGFHEFPRFDRAKARFGVSQSVGFEW